LMASVAHLADEQQRDRRVLHGDGTNTVAQTGGMASGIPAIHSRRARRLSPLPITRALSSLHAPLRQCMQPTWCCCLRACEA
jgi:hypothetical protein